MLAQHYALLRLYATLVKQKQENKPLLIKAF